MKKIFVTLTIAVLLTGCSLLPQYYDNNEYELLARLETTVRLMQDDCPEPDKVLARLPRLIEDAELLHTYTFYIPRNTDVYEMANILRDDVREFEDQYDTGKANPLYCKLKTKAFLTKVRRSLEAVAQKARN